MELIEALEIVIKLARTVATSVSEKEACDIVEDYCVNELGEE